MIQTTSNKIIQIPYQHYFFIDPEVCHWLIEVEWPDVYAALDLDPTNGDYDGTRDDEISQMLRASGAPDPFDCYYDQVGWVAFSMPVTHDELTAWALCYPRLAGRTDDEQGLYERYITWANRSTTQVLQNSGTTE